MMRTFPDEFLDLMIHYRSLFSKSVYYRACLLLSGTILTLGKRTVSSVLRTLGLSKEKHFCNYHRLLSRAHWSALSCAQVLLHQLISAFLPDNSRLVFVIDETLERRWGSKIKKRGIYRDSVRSSKSHVVKCSGLRWVSLMFVPYLSWAKRCWALPFLTVLACSERYSTERGITHKKLTDWARQMIYQLKRWLPYRELVIVADGGYACIALLASVRTKVTMITSLRLDAALYAPAPPRVPGKPGRNRKKGERLANLSEVLKDKHTQWQTVVFSEWYGHLEKRMQVCSHTAVWYHSGKPVVPLRWVLLRDPENKLKPRAILCTDLEMSAIEIVQCFLRRWAVEVTFEEVRRHLGVETQRQWSDKAIERTTPVLFGLFSLVTLMADQLAQKGKLVMVKTAWYKKKYPTFSDAIINVRKLFWKEFNFSTSVKTDDKLIISKDLLNHMQHILTGDAYG